MDDAELIQQLCEAGAGLQELIDSAAEIMVRYLVPDGIDADQAIAEIIALLDGPRQRAVEDRWEAVAGTEYASARAKEDAEHPERVIQMPRRK